jgi:hypothetical protein
MSNEALWPLRAVSKDATNLTKLDADNNILTSSTDVDARYVRKVGDTITGNMVFQGASNAFAQASVNSLAVGPLQFVERTTSGNLTRTLLLTDAGKVIINRTPVGLFTTLIPADSAVNFPAGTVVEVVNASADITNHFYIKADAGVSLFYNSTLGAGSDGSLGGGVAAQVRLRGPMTSARIMKQSANSWVIFGDLVTT